MPLLQTVQYEGCQFKLLDLTAIHPSGNKYFKLKENIAHAKRTGHDTLLSFGGAWSNHIHALAHASREHGLKTIGIIRGEQPKKPGLMLQDVAALGMSLHFVPRHVYRNRNSQAFQELLIARHGDFYMIPEGGSNPRGVAGAREIARLLDNVSFEEVVLPVGTGGTLAGIASSLSPDKRVLGISVLKGALDLAGTIEGFAPGLSNWRLDHAAHEGGYARVSPRLKAFILDFEIQTDIKIEPVYTGKMLYRLMELLKAGALRDVIAIHTGGLQGRRGFKF